MKLKLNRLVIRIRRAFTVVVLLHWGPWHICRQGRKLRGGGLLDVAGLRGGGLLDVAGRRVKDV
jgi:hypothetical protein